MKTNNRYRRLKAVLCGLFISASTLTFSQQWQLIDYPYEGTGTFVAAYSVKDEGAVGDGETDDTAVFQTVLQKLEELGGGTLYVPEGKYKITKTLLLPKGVTIRGEWRKPVKGQPVSGSILMAYYGKGQESLNSFIRMRPSSAVMDLTIWYPEQDPENITPYPPTICMGTDNYFGNENCNVKNVTFINSYTALIFSRTNGGTCPVVNGIYGTPLALGVEIDNLVDVGRVENVDFSPEYWAGSGLPGSPSSNSSFRDWIYDNGTGMIMRRNDWSYTCYAHVEGYNIGFHAAESRGSKGAYPNGHNYELTFRNCRTGILFDGVSDVGIMFTRVDIKDCVHGIEIGSGTSGAAQFYKSDIRANTSVVVDPTSVSKLMMQECTFTRGTLLMDGGTLTAVDCDFNNKTPQVVLNPNSRGLLSGNRFAREADIANNSLFECVIDHTPVKTEKLPDFPVATPLDKKPARMALYVVTDAPFNAKNDEVTDNTQAIQSALNKAAEEGGGVVFLPPGKYKVTGNLSVPTGVELKGAVDVSTVPTGPSSVLEVYAGKGNPSGEPFLKMASGSGIRGIVFNYPEQISTMLPTINQYPYCIQVTGEDAYIINVGMRAVYNGIDMFTYKCDNHYVDYLAGHVFKNAIRVGGGSENGQIYNLQFNLQPYACGSESKYGGWANSPEEGGDAVYSYGMAELDFLILENCKNQILYNDFVYGTNRGIVLRADANGNAPHGLSMGLGLDGCARAMCLEGVSSDGFNFINSQIVSIREAASTTRYIESTKDFSGKVTLFSSNYWGSPQKGIVLLNGEVNLQAGFFSAPGQSGLATLSNGTGTLNLVNSGVSSLGTTLGPEKLSVHSCVIGKGSVNISKAAVWENNLDYTPVLDPGSAFDRTGWTATASHNNEKAGNGIDGDDVTRWDTGMNQQEGQWYMVDMKATKVFNQVVLDTSNSSSDSPNEYTVEVSVDGISFTEVAAGKGTDKLTLMTMEEQNARFIRINQTGSKTGYWSIHEFYVFNLERTTGVEEINFTSEPLLWHDGVNLYSALLEGAQLTVYNLSGDKLIEKRSSTNCCPVNLHTGVYLLQIENAGQVYRHKLLIR